MASVFLIMRRNTVSNETVVETAFDNLKAAEKFFYAKVDMVARNSENKIASEKAIQERNAIAIRYANLMLTYHENGLRDHTVTIKEMISNLKAIKIPVYDSTMDDIEYSIRQTEVYSVCL